MANQTEWAKVESAIQDKHVISLGYEDGEFVGWGVDRRGLEAQIKALRAAGISAPIVCSIQVDESDDPASLRRIAVIE